MHALKSLEDITLSDLCARAQTRLSYLDLCLPWWPWYGSRESWSLILCMIAFSLTNREWTLTWKKGKDKLSVKCLYMFADFCTFFLSNILDAYNERPLITIFQFWCVHLLCKSKGLLHIIFILLTMNIL